MQQLTELLHKWAFLGHLNIQQMALEASMSPLDVGI